MDLSARLRQFYNNLLLLNIFDIDYKIQCHSLGQLEYYYTDGT